MQDIFAYIVSLVKIFCISAITVRSMRLYHARKILKLSCYSVLDIINESGRTLYGAYSCSSLRI